MSNSNLLSRFFEKANKDQRLTAMHISIYAGLAASAFYSCSNGIISISRSRIKKLSRVQSNTTYHKCIKDLQEFGYIKYTPSYHPKAASAVEFIN